MIHDFSPESDVIFFCTPTWNSPIHNAEVVFREIVFSKLSSKGRQASAQFVILLLIIRGSIIISNVFPTNSNCRFCC